MTDKVRYSTRRRVSTGRIYSGISRQPIPVLKLTRYRPAAHPPQQLLKLHHNEDDHFLYELRNHNEDLTKPSITTRTSLLLLDDSPNDISEVERRKTNEKWAQSHQYWRVITQRKFCPAKCQRIPQKTFYDDNDFSIAIYRSKGGIWWKDGAKGCRGGTELADKQWLLLLKLKTRHHRDVFHHQKSFDEQTNIHIVPRLL
jgi:hypothetical protein